MDELDIHLAHALLYAHCPRVLKTIACMWTGSFLFFIMPYIRIIQRETLKKFNKMNNINIMRVRKYNAKKKTDVLGRHFIQ